MPARGKRLRSERMRGAPLVLNAGSSSVKFSVFGATGDGAWLGVTLDEAANARHGPRISRPGARVSAWVIPTDENRVVAEHARRVLDELGGGNAPSLNARGIAP